MKQINQNVTICIKTFLRPQSLSNCLDSIRLFYPNVKILLANDGPEPICNKKADKIFNLPFDTGLSASRNFLLNQVKTEFVLFLDDDTIFTKDSKLELMLNVLENNKNIDLVAGHLTNNPYYGTLEKEGDILYRNFYSSRRTINGFHIYDFVLNLFMARTSKIKYVLWDEDLKIVEHMDFFWRSIGVINSTRLRDVQFINTSEKNPEYSKFRINRSGKFMRLQCNKIGVKKILSRVNKKK